MKFKEKLNSIFGFKAIKEAEGAEVWMVYWYTIRSSYSGNLWDKGRQVGKAFLLKEDAETFAKSLQDANDLLQNRNDICCEIVKQK